MKIQETINQIRQYIGNSNIDKAFEQIKNCSELWVNPDSRDVFLQLKSNYQLLKMKSIKGTISSESYSTNLNVIISNLLSFLNNVEEVINYHEFKLGSGELTNDNLLHLEIPKYLGVNNIWKRVKIFFSKKRNKNFSLYLVKTKQYCLIDCPEYVEVENLSKYVASILFPKLKEQHFIWRLESNKIRISNITTVQNLQANMNQPLNLTAEYKHHDELWGDIVEKKIVMDEKKNPNKKLTPDLKLNQGLNNTMQTPNQGSNSNNLPTA